MEKYEPEFTLKVAASFLGHAEQATDFSEPALSEAGGGTGTLSPAAEGVEQPWSSKPRRIQCAPSAHSGPASQVDALSIDWRGFANIRSLTFPGRPFIIFK